MIKRLSIKRVRAAADNVGAKIHQYVAKGYEPPTTCLEIELYGWFIGTYMAGNIQAFYPFSQIEGPGKMTALANFLHALARELYGGSRPDA